MAADGSCSFSCLYMPLPGREALLLPYTAQPLPFTQALPSFPTEHCLQGARPSLLRPFAHLLFLHLRSFPSTLSTLQPHQPAHFGTSPADTAATSSSLLRLSGVSSLFPCLSDSASRRPSHLFVPQAIFIHTFSSSSALPWHLEPLRPTRCVSAHHWALSWLWPQCHLP